VKTIRIWLLVLLAVLLPVRGAVAAAMLCSPANAGDHSHVSAVAGHHEHDAHADPRHAGHDTGSPAGTGHHADGSSQCNLCCDFCSMTPLLSTLPSVPPPDLSSVPFPELCAAAPSFLSEGQERPPRSI